MTVQRLAALLSHLDPEFSGDDLCDMLWLAPHLEAPSTGPAGREPSPPVQDDGAVPESRPGRPTERAADRSPGGRAHAVRDPAPTYSVHLRQVGITESGIGMRGETVRAPEPPALADQLALTRAMRALIRTTPSRHRVVLDEEATAVRVAEEHLWVPELKPAPIRWLDLALVVDRHQSMSIWRRPIAELQVLMERLGAFRDVQLWMLDQSDDDLDALPGVRRQPESPLRSARELMDPAGRRVIIVVSDCLGPMWESGAVHHVLADWAEHGPVAIFQPLPQRLWAYSHARPTPVRLHALQAAIPNKHLDCRTPAGDRMTLPPRAVPVPVLQMDPVWLGSWSRLLTASGTSGVDSMVLFVGAEPAVDAEAAARTGSAGSHVSPAPAGLSPQRRLERFRATASPEAMRLAQYLSATPISLPVIRLVQRAMMPSAGRFALAEVFLGGLLFRLDAQDGAESDDAQYDFLPGVRELLLRRLRKKEALRTLREVSEYVGAHFGQARDFRALLAGADLAGDLLIGPDSRPFATVAAQVLRLLGGRYAETAARLSAALDPSGPKSVSPGLAGGAAAGSATRPARAGQIILPGPVGADDEKFLQALSRISLTDRRSPLRPLACPYCYHAFAEQDIMFRCSGQAPAGREACSSRPDPVLIREMGEHVVLPPAFEVDTYRDEVACPTCQNRTRTQICPGCHSRLPATFRAMQGRLIALVGPSQAGKTAFLTVLIHELRHGMGDVLLSSTQGADDTTMQRFTNSYERPLYKRSELSFHHPLPAGDRYISPLVFRFAMNRRGRFRPNSRELLLSFADSAGEDLVSPDKIDLMARYLAAADAVLVLIDPLRFPDVRERVSRRTPLPSPMRPEQEAVASFNRITALLMAGTGQQLIDKPVAVVLSKVDALSYLLEPDSPLHRPSPMKPYFEEMDNLTVQDQVRAMLKNWGASGLDETVRRHYSRCRYFGVSALGATPTENNRVADQGIHPYRVTDPHLWLLNEFGFVPSR
ncbi:MAG: SAV_2336 N-terminal domain-related protein [Streptosporangiaceae bacterium]